MPSRVALVALAVLVVASAAVAPALANQAGGDSGVSKSTTSETYSYEELSSGGTRVPEIHEGWRPIEGSTAAAWLQYYPTGLFVDDSRGSSDWQYLSPSTTVKRNYVVLTVMRLGDAEREKATLKVAYWNKGTRKETVGNTTREVDAALNQTVEEVEVSLSGRGTRVRVPLKPHYDEKKQVTMWLESSDDSTRWRYTHHSLKSAQESPVDSAGDLAMTIGKVVLIGSVLVVVALLAGRLLNRRGIVGPMKGTPWWCLVLGGGQLLFVLVAWDTVANALATHPELLALELGLVGFIQGIESRGVESTFKAVAIRADVKPAKTAAGNKGVTAQSIGHNEVRVAKDSRGRHVLVEPGIIRWIIRLLGERQYLEGTDVIRCTIEVTDGEAELCYYVDPTSDEVIQRESPSLGLSLPKPSLYQIGAALGGAYLIGVLAEVAGVGWMTGIAALTVPAAFAVLDADAPNALIEPAPSQMADAHANSMVLGSEYSAVKTVEDAQDELVKEQAKRSVRAERADEERATTLVEETLGNDVDEDGSVFDVIDKRDDARDLLERLSSRGDDDDDSGVTIADD